MGFDYAMALRELEDDEATKKADQVDEKTFECDHKFDAVKHLVLNSFWARFAEGQISTLVKEANSALDEAEATDHLQLSRKDRELMNRNLEREVCEVNNLITEWTDMIPQAKLTESRDISRTMRKQQERLWDKWAWRRSAWSDDREEQKEQVKLNNAGKKDENEENQARERDASTSSPPNRKLSCPLIHPYKRTPAKPTQRSHLSQLWCTSKCYKHTSASPKCSQRVPRATQFQAPNPSRTITPAHIFWKHERLLSLES